NEYSQGWKPGRDFGLYAPPGRYTLRFKAVVDTYTAGFTSGDDGAPGLFVEGPVEVGEEETTVEWTLPLVGFPVHVVDRAGSPVPGVWLEGESRSSFEVAPGVVASGRVLNANSVRTDQAGNARLLTFEGSAPATVNATNVYETLGRAGLDPAATSTTLVLDSPVLQGRLLDARGLLPEPASMNAWVAFARGTVGGQFAPWPYGTGDSTYRVQAVAGDRTLTVSNADVHDRADPSERPASATLPGIWTFAAPYQHAGDATVDLTIPDAAPGDILVLGADGQPVSGVTMQYVATADNTIDLAPGITARATASDTIGEVGGHFAPMLFGPSTFMFGFDGVSPVNGPITISPGEAVTIRLADETGRPSAPQNVTATAGDGKVKVTWDPPADDGGSPITGYTVTASRNASNTKASFGADATSGTIRSLTNGKAYTVTVVAKNANGAGPASAPLSVTLDAVEPAPTATTTTTTATGPTTGNSGADPIGGAGIGGDKTGTVTQGSGRSGYWLLGADGAVYPFGDAAPHGDASAAISAANAGEGAPAGSAVRAVDIEPTPSGRGYWVVDNQGRVRPFGDASHLGDVVVSRLSAGEEPASLSSTPTGAGYWVFTNRGRALTFGDAAFLGDVSGTPLNGPVLDSVATPTGRGYYMVASDGGIFAFGDARFAGSMGGRRLNAAVRSLVPDADGAGYWLVASDGGIFAFDAPFRGSLGGVRLNGPVRGMVRYGDGYVMVGEDGGIFAFSD
ncbi:MAG TPA: fibronectin type III domain-containing protein, partial [Acidimicrobiia bacterium]|nr:fibronectin type III domain-containing protein [Acidimicrobiia bacterium]